MVMTLVESKRSDARNASGISESHISEVQRTEICWTNYPASAEDIEDIRGIPGAKRRGIDGSWLIVDG